MIFEKVLTLLSSYSCVISFFRKYYMKATRGECVYIFSDQKRFSFIISTNWNCLFANMERMEITHQYRMNHSHVSSN